MKKYIKTIVIIIIASIISCIFACIPVESNEEVLIDEKDLDLDKYNYRVFKGIEPAAQGYNLYYDVMINTAAYLCAWHGGHFFYRQPVVIEYKASLYGGSWEGEYLAKETWEHFIDGKWERNCADTFTITSDIAEWNQVELSINDNDMKNTFDLELEAAKYSGKAYYPSVNKIWGSNEQEGVSKQPDVTVTSTGWTRFTVILDHQHEENNAMSYLLADCDDNAKVTPSQSYVNVAFWAQLSARGIGSVEPGAGKVSSNLGTISASSMDRAILATMSTYKDVEDCLEKLKRGDILSNEECEDILNTAKVNQIDENAYKLYAIIEEYKKGENKENKSTINEFKRLLEILIEDMKKNSKDDNLKDERKQNSEDFDSMWDKINEEADGIYENTVSDCTDQDAVIVEYNATTQKYLVGPFTITYIEKYTSNWSLAGMAGDPVLKVRKDNKEVTIPKSSGKWNFYYLNDLRVDGIPGTEDNKDEFGYNEYPHNNEPFYIQLNYEEGINAILGLKVYFRYMKSEAEWSRSKGEIENVLWSGGLGYSRCGIGRGLNGLEWESGLCDGGGYEILRECHKDTNTGGKTHYHESAYEAPEIKPGDTYVPWSRPTNHRWNTENDTQRM